MCNVGGLLRQLKDYDKEVTLVTLIKQNKVVSRCHTLQAHKTRQNRMYGSIVLSCNNSMIEYSKFGAKFGYKFRLINLIYIISSIKAN